jgi:hypothetical protein
MVLRREKPFDAILLTLVLAIVSQVPTTLAAIQRPELRAGAQLFAILVAVVLSVVVDPRRVRDTIRPPAPRFRQLELELEPSLRPPRPLAVTAAPPSEEKTPAESPEAKNATR